MNSHVYFQCQLLSQQWGQYLLCHYTGKIHFNPNNTASVNHDSRNNVLNIDMNTSLPRGITAYQTLLKSKVQILSAAELWRCLTINSRGRFFLTDSIRLRSRHLFAGEPLVWGSWWWSSSVGLNGLQLPLLSCRRSGLCMPFVQQGPDPFWSITDLALSIFQCPAKPTAHGNGNKVGGEPQSTHRHALSR